MAETALYPMLLSAGVRLADYRGATTAARFTAPAAEFAALREGCGVFDMGWRVRTVVTGEDRVRWLNGMVTNNVRDLEANRGVYAFVLNPQGRIQGDLYCYQRGDYLLLETDAAQQAHLFGMLQRYIVMDAVTLTDISAQLSALGLQGPRAADILRKAGILSRELEILEITDTEWNGTSVSIARLDMPGPPQFELLVAPHEAVPLWQALTTSGATATGSDACEMMRIAAGVPLYGQDIRERDLPQETGQQRALNFTKGCYVGQEIVERIRSRGLVHRQFTGFLFQGALPAAGTKIEAGGRGVAEITSVARLPLPQGPLNVGLGYVRREAAEAELRIAFEPVQLSSLPFRAIAQPLPQHAPAVTE